MRTLNKILILATVVLALLMYPQTYIAIKVYSADALTLAKLSNFGGYDLAGKKRKDGQIDVVFMFDDGWKSVYTTAYPLFAKYGLRASLAIIPAKLSEHEYMSFNEVGELYMNGWEVFNFTIREVPELAIETLSQNKWQLDDVDLFLLHQPNKMILQHLIRKLGIPADKAPINIGRYGNTSGVSIPLLIVDDVKDKLMTSAKNVLLLGFGVGYAWAGAALTLNSIKVLDLINPSFD